MRESQIEVSMLLLLGRTRRRCGRLMLHEQRGRVDVAKGRSVGESHVVLEVSQLSESLAANLAGERLLPGVNELVALQFGWGGKLFPAVADVPSVVHRGGVAVGRHGPGAHLEVQRKREVTAPSLV